jgi:hypothetical protein
MALGIGLSMGLNMWASSGAGYTLTNASASAGVFSSANYFSNAAGVGGPDLTAGNGVAVLFNVSSVAPTDQVCLAYANGTSGWALDCTSTKLVMQFRNGGTTQSQNLGSTVLQLGYHCAVIVRRVDGSLWASVDGAAAFQVAASPTYTTCTSGATIDIGRVNPAWASLPFTGGVMMSAAYFTVDPGATVMQTWSACVNAINRNEFDPTLRAYGGLVWEWNCLRDYSGGATTVTGLGSAPVTFTKAGTVALNAISAEHYWPDTAIPWRDTVAAVAATSQLGVPYNLRSTYAHAVGNTTTGAFAVDGVWDMDNVHPAGLQAYTAMTLQAPTGTYIGNGVAAALADQGIRRTRDFTSFTPSASIEITEGFQSNLGVTTRRASAIKAIRVPATNPISWVAGGSTANRLALCGDSILTGLFSTTPPQSGWAALIRKNRGGVLIDSYGGRSYKDICVDASARTAFVAALGAMLDGTVSNAWWNQLGINDYLSSLWSMATAASNIAALYDAIHAAYPALVIYMVTPIITTQEATANGFGDTPPTVRSTLTTIQSTRSGWITLVDGTTLVTSGGISADKIHPTTAGHVTLESNTRTILGY